MNFFCFRKIILVSVVISVATSFISCSFDGGSISHRVCSAEKICAPGMECIDGYCQMQSADITAEDLRVEDTAEEDSQFDREVTQECYDQDSDGFLGSGFCDLRGEELDCDDRNSRINPGAEELCDGLDNNCDGETDEVCDCRYSVGVVLTQDCYSGPEDTIGIGVCQSGEQLCMPNGMWGNCDNERLPTEESCDNMGTDDDCDGELDEDENGELITSVCYDGDPADIDIGICRAGIRSCSSDSCEGAVYPEEEYCDNLDNDCDGIVDEDLQGNPLAFECYLGDPTTIGVGECRSGQRGCGDPESTCFGAVYPEEDICDGLDNNCDGEADEDGCPVGLCCRGVCIPPESCCDDVDCNGCVGRVTLCNDLDADECEEQQGCLMGGCGGGLNCFLIGTDEELCRSCGCNWSSPRCLGASNCSELGQDVCQDCGCLPNPVCLGVSMVCPGIFTQEGCSEQHGCHWRRCENYVCR